MKRILIQMSFLMVLSYFLGTSVVCAMERREDPHQHPQQRVITHVKVEPFPNDIRERLQATSTQRNIGFDLLVRLGLPGGAVIDSGVNGTSVALRAAEYIYPDQERASYRSGYPFLGEDLPERMSEMNNGRLGDSVLYFDSSNPHARGDYVYIEGCLFSPRFDDDTFYRLVPHGSELTTPILSVRLVYLAGHNKIFAIGGNPPAEDEAH